MEKPKITRKEAEERIERAKARIISILKEHGIKIEAGVGALTEEDIEEFHRKTNEAMWEAIEESYEIVE